MSGSVDDHMSELVMGHSFSGSYSCTSLGGWQRRWGEERERGRGRGGEGRVGGEGGEEGLVNNMMGRLWAYNLPSQVVIDNGNQSRY